MGTARQLSTVAFAGLAALFVAGAAVGDETKSTVDVTFWDKAGMEMATNLGHGMAGDMSKATMGFTLSVAEVTAGEVTFTGTNASESIIHEMIVAPLTSADEILPYDAAEGVVDEEAAGAIGEIAELDPGQTGTLTLHLDAGEYILFCNIPGHYMDGMWVVLKVT